MPLGTGWAATDLPPMPRFYFDHHDSLGALPDDEGYEAVDAPAAKRLALELLGQAIMDGASCNPTMGRITIVVRDDAGPILSVSATVEVAEHLGGCGKPQSP
jgi:hypothetical protein